MERQLGGVRLDLEVKTIFAYETFQEIVYLLPFARHMLCTAYVSRPAASIRFFTQIIQGKKMETMNRISVGLQRNFYCNP